jgi:hypothetical protein
MRCLTNAPIIAATSMILVTAAGAQIRAPIAGAPSIATAPGPAPYNAKATPTGPTSVAVSWSAVSGVRGYTVDRARTDDAACCVAHSGLITTPAWNDGALEAGKEYSFAITALYADGRTGNTEVVAATPMPTLPAVRLPRINDSDVSAAEGVLRLTPCGQKTTGGPGPGTIVPQDGTPAGARFHWTPVADMNYVVERAPERNTTTWTLVGSTCGGPSPVTVASDAVFVRDLAGGVIPDVNYIYRVTAISSTGASGWNTYHFVVPCKLAPVPRATVSGSTVTLEWSPTGACGNSPPAIDPDTYTISSSFGYTKTKSSRYWTREWIYGVPVGTHTFTMVGNYRTGGSTNTSSINVTVAY